MATSGQATAVPPRRAGEVSAPVPGLRRTFAGFAVVCCLAGLVVGGCAVPTFKLGKPPAVDRLSELKAGVSTAKDVIAALGEPQGRGATRSQSFPLQDAWLYESTETDGMKARIRMLMVFLDKETGVYNGHMWMGSGLLFGQTKE